MPEHFYLYFINRGWVTASSTYTSDWKEAALFSESDAFTRARRGAGTEGLTLLPISEADLLQITKHLK